MDSNGQELIFLVQGSRPKPYKIRFYGSGESLEARCSCPAGRNTGKFCKHIAGLLKGETDKLVDGADAIPELLERAQGSPLVAQAHRHIAAPPKPAQIDLGEIQTLKDLAEHATGKLASLEYWCEHTQEENETERVSIYQKRYGKTGKPLKKPALLLQISFEPFYREFPDDMDGGEAPAPQRKSMPWMVGSTNYGKFVSAASRFLIKLDALVADAQGKVNNEIK